jgi:cytochrome c biogenesis protein CcmG/thiol:disulfide interchange protein DsbE
MALPLIAFAALAALFWFRLGDGDPSKIPSALIGRPVPQTELPPLEGLVNGSEKVPGLDPAVFKGKVSVVNVWASRCVPCHDEAPLLTGLAKDKRLQLIGINYKDAPDNARRFLGRYGNPFGIVGADGNGRAAIEWGVYGVPETFVVGREGTIIYKQVGPVTPDNIDTVLKAEIDKALVKPE